MKQHTQSSLAPLAITLGDAAGIGPEIVVKIDLGRGNATQTMWTCDLSHDYVSINADYRS